MHLTHAFCRALADAHVHHDGAQADLAFGRFLCEATEALDFPRFALPLAELARRAIAQTPNDVLGDSELWPSPSL